MSKNNRRYKSTGIISPGGKYHALPVILQYFPPHTSTLKFLDVFTGSAVVALNYGAKNTVINDKNDYIYAFMTVMGSHKFENLIIRYPDHERRPDWERRYSIFREFETEIESVVRGERWFEAYRDRTDIVGKAILYLILNRNNRMGKVDLSEKSPFHRRIPERGLFKQYDNLVRFMDTHDVRVYNDDFRAVLKKARSWHDTDRQQIFVYLDPPYVEAGSNLYTHTFTEDDLRDLAKLLSEIEHHWIMSNEDTPLVRELFTDYNFKRVRWQNAGQQLTTGKMKAELVVSNRPITKRPRGTDTIDKFLKRKRV